MALKTNYKDDVFTGNRKYKKIDNSDGTISLEDVTEYSQEGDTLSATDVNSINSAVNSNATAISSNTTAISSNASAIKSNTTAIATKQDKILTFTNKTVATSAFAEDTTISGFGYRASIALSGVTSNHLVTVIPNQATNDLGILSVEVDSYNGGVYIYAKSVPTVSLTFNVIKAEKI